MAWIKKIRSQYHKFSVPVYNCSKQDAPWNYVVWQCSAGCPWPWCCFRLNPFTPESDQCQNSPAASQEIWHHTVWRTWLFMAYSDEKWLYYKFSLHHSYNRFLKGWENTLFELRCERGNGPNLTAWVVLQAKYRTTYRHSEPLSFKKPITQSQMNWKQHASISGHAEEFCVFELAVCNTAYWWLSQEKAKPVDPELEGSSSKQWMPIANLFQNHHFIPCSMNHL